MNYRMVSTTVGKILIAEAILMLLPLSVAFYYREVGTPWTFVLTAVLLLGFGFLLEIKRPRHRRIYAREGFMIVAISWILISLFGALPFLFSGAIANPVDALFETVSGFTTTGASILTDIESLPKSILFWRSFTHWIGGMGILVFVLAFLPQRENQSMHIMRAEVPGPTMGKLVSKTMMTARILYIIYFALTILEIIFLLFGGMPFFDSVTTAFATAGTGGFSVRNASIAAYDSLYCDVVISVFMILFGVNFNLYFLLLMRQFGRVFKSEELRWYLGIIAFATTVIALDILPMYKHITTAVRLAGFQVASIITTTGFSTADYTEWPVFSQMVLLALFCIGACAGSTGGGFKVERMMVLCKSVLSQIKKSLNGREVVAVKVDGKSVDKSYIHSVLAYLGLYVVVVFVGIFLVCFDQVDMQEAIGAVLTCFNNVGPAFGRLSPSGNFSVLSPFTKLVLSFLMLAGRLEIYPMLIVFYYKAWKRKN